MPIARPHPSPPTIVRIVLLTALAILPRSWAGDVLRGGVPYTNQPQRAATQSQSINAAAAAARANAKDNLARTTRAVLEAQRFQQSARAAAAAAPRDSLGINPNLPGTNTPLPTVPNGLGTGGLEIDPGVVGGTAPWTGAGQPLEQKSGGVSNIRIRQTAQTALLSWKTFNIGRKTSLYFDQRAGGTDAKKWVAFNQITDPSGVPSQILGSIKADGQVYVINRNGIIFGPTSQVRMPTFVASSLPINTNLINSGLLNNPDAQFLFSGLDIPQGKSGTPPFTPGKPFIASGRYGNVTVQPGAVLSSPTDSAKAGGRIMLVGANVTNRGTIKTPDGQTILAAGLQVGVDGHPSSDASLRGLDVFVGAIAPTGGTPYAGQVLHNGIVEAPRGNVTMAGSAIRQNGVIASSTSVSFNGRIDIQASYGAISNTAYVPTNATTGRPFLFLEAGSVEFGPGSVTRIVPETFSDETVIGTELALKSQIQVLGKTIHLNRGAAIQANGGDISLRAGRYNFVAGSLPISPFVRSGGQIYLESESMIDASGSVSGSVPLSRELLELELRGAELARSPLQRSGLLRGVPITIDLRESGTYGGSDWIGTPLGDARGFANLIQRDAAELTSKGGNISLIAGSSVVAQPGSTIDVSGGLITYEGAVVRTTRLRSSGQLFDISDAVPSRVYDSVYEGVSTVSNPKWGITRTFQQPLALTGERFQPSYAHGAGGGTVNINGASVALDGEILGRTIDGQLQQASPAPLSSLLLSFLNDDTNFATFPAISPTPPNIYFGNGSLPRVGAFRTNPDGTPVDLPTARKSNVVLDPELTHKTGGGFGFLSINNPDGNISVPRGVSLAAAPGGGFSFSASTITIDGSVAAPGGSLSFTAHNLPLSEFNRVELVTRANPTAIPGRGRFALGSSARLSTSGLLIDQTPSGFEVMPTDFIHGGTIDIRGFNVNLADGGVIDVSGGALVRNRNEVTYGDGGLVEIHSGTDQRIPSVLGGSLTLGASLRGYSGATGGSLSLAAPGFRIGPGPITAPSTVRLDPGFFSQGGFSHFHLTAMGIKPSTTGQLDSNGVEVYPAGITIAPGTKIRPIVEGLLAMPHQVGATRSYQLRRFVRPEGLRSPAHLEFEAPGVADPYNNGFLITRGDIIMGKGASIETDVLGSVSFSAQTVTMLGKVAAPGGEVSIEAATSFPTATSIPVVGLPTVYIGPQASLSAVGQSATRLGARGARVGTIASGGRISISGNIVAERGSIFDVSGTSGVLDLVSGYSDLGAGTVGSLRGLVLEETRFDTDGGLISLNGADMLYVDSTLRATPGGKSAAGGALEISSSRFVAPNTGFSDADINLAVKQSGYTLNGSAASRGIGRPLSAGGVPLPGLGTFSMDRLRGSGVETLTLGGNVRFDGNVSVSMAQSLRVASRGILESTGHTQLSAPFVKLGQNLPTPFLASDPILPFLKTDITEVVSQDFVVPTNGTGRLTVRADLVESGNLVLKQIGAATISARRGDIRGAGNLLIAGDIVLDAGQIYPVTASRFNIFAYDYLSGGSTKQGSVTISGGNSRPLPLSAGGTLSIQASNIRHSGTLRAPLGSIVLGWDGQGAQPTNPVSVNAIGTPVTRSISLQAGSVTSVAALDPKSGRDATIPYGISFDGLAWIDPAGNDITISGSPQKSIRLAAESIATAKGATIDLRGGGDYFAYRWVEGNGGPTDILDSSAAFAILPGYQFDYAPVAPFNSRSSAVNLQGAEGYVNDTLKVGDKVALGKAEGLQAGYYTLLPARYALMPGAFLVTPQEGNPVGSLKQPDGSSLTNGYRVNTLNSTRRGITNMGRFEVAPNSVIQERADYRLLSANSFLRNASLSRSLPPPRLPVDAGQLTFASIGTLAIAGDILGRSSRGGQGSLVDISTPLDIVINRDASGGGPGILALSSGLLSRIGAESLLIGGSRSSSTEGTSISVATGSITVNNQGSPLSGAEIILTAKQGITLSAGSTVEGKGEASPANLILGSSATPGSGDGALVRVSGGSAGSVERRGVSNSIAPYLNLADGATVTGASITLDSTAATDLSATARIIGQKTLLSSGQISLLLDNPGALNPTQGLVLSGPALRSLEDSARSIVLRSYSSIDIYGTGTFGTAATEFLSLQASSIRGYNSGAIGSTFTAEKIEVGNAAGLSPLAPSASPANGRLIFDANQISTGSNTVRIENFANVDLIADSRLLAASNGSIVISGNATIATPLVTGQGGALTSIGATGDLTLLDGGSATPGAASGIGANLTLSGARVVVDTAITLRSGTLTLRADSGDLSVGTGASTLINVGGVTRSFLDVTRYTNGGRINLISDNGSVNVGNLASLNVSATGLADAGLLNIQSPNGLLTLSGAIIGTADSGRRTGSLQLDTSSVTGNDLSVIDDLLNAGSFGELRDYRIRTGSLAISGSATAKTYRVSVDSGDLSISGAINASGRTGGTIDLAANGNLTLQSGALLDASAETFDAAGKGGAISLAAGTSRNGTISPLAELNMAGGTIDLRVDDLTADSASRGQFSGTLHLRAPQDQATYSTVQMKQIGSTVQGASSILVEAYRLYNQASGLLDNSLRDTIRSDANALFGSSGATTAAYAAMINKLDPSGQFDLLLAPGAEIINPGGSLTMGSSSSPSTQDWDLAAFRFGPRSAPGVLTMRAAQDIVFFNALSDGFTVDTSASSPGNSLWLAPISTANPNLPVNRQSWSYRLTAGADLQSANFRDVLPITGPGAIGEAQGFLDLGKNLGAANITGGSAAQTSTLVTSNFQVIRTGSGDIDINTARSLRLLNPFAAIYTAGTQVADPSTVATANDFVTPVQSSRVGQGNLGSLQQAYGAYYSMAGGNVNIFAGQNLERKTRNNSGLIDDSSRQLPNNWLYRRGFVGDDGNFGSVNMGSGSLSVTDPAASTSWWIDFSNFFQTSGALGGGHVTLEAGVDVRNFDAVIPTNARAPRGAAATSALLELGGGDLLVKAGRNIDGGVYYVERGVGRLQAGSEITTNSTRSPSLGLLQSLNNPSVGTLAPSTWMPTALFMGKSSFDVFAGGDVLMGPVSNPFLLPQGQNNGFWYKTYFSTYGDDSSVQITSLGGDVSLRNSVTTRDRTTPADILRLWLERQNLLSTGPTGAANSQPWLRLAESSIAPFASTLPLRPPVMNVTSLDGEINLSGSFTLYPSPQGQLELIAGGGSVNGLQATGVSEVLVPGRSTTTWSAARVNVSDADPGSLPRPLSPFNYYARVGTRVNDNNSTRSNFFEEVDARFNDSGSTTGVFGITQTKLALHSSEVLHRNDSNPLRVFAMDGDISGLTLFSPKFSRLYASNDISDISLYLQNAREGDSTFITAGRDIIPYNAASALRKSSLESGNLIAANELPLSGDIHLGGPGSLQILAGRNLDLGTGPTNADGTGSGVITLGNIRNLALPFAGADIIAAAGVGSATSLLESELNMTSFIDTFVLGPDGAPYLSELGVKSFAALSPEEQARVALDVFYLVLRDTGRAYNLPGDPGFGNYNRGFAAISSLFGPISSGAGNISAQTRNFRTRTGGDIALLAPNGGITLSNTLLANAAVPPGIVTEAGGKVSIFADQSVDIGVGRIFTLRGGDLMIWSSQGDIAAGAASKTVASAPPTRVIIDPQTGAVETDLAGLSTGGGIGVLAAVANVKPGDVDLIAPAGIIDAGDAGIRVTGNINLAATAVVNASNISVGGSSSGAPSAPSVAAPSLGGLASSANASAATSNAAATNAESNRQQTAPPETVETPSIISVEVIGYGGGSAPEDKEEEEENRRG